MAIFTVDFTHIKPNTNKKHPTVVVIVVDWLVHLFDHSSLYHQFVINHYLLFPLMLTLHQLLNKSQPFSDNNRQLFGAMMNVIIIGRSFYSSCYKHSHVCIMCYANVNAVCSTFTIISHIITTFAYLKNRNFESNTFFFYIHFLK